MALIHQWKFNNDLTDSIGNLDFSNTRGLVTFVDGLVQKCLNFQDGFHGPLTSGVFTQSNPLPSTVDAPWTISFWVKSVEEDIIFYIYGGGDTRFYISIKTSTDSLSVGFNNGFDSGVALIKLGATDFNQQFTNIIIIYKGPNEPLSLALNGTQQDLFFDGTTPSPNTLDYSIPFSTERIVDNTNIFFITNTSNGYQLDDLRIYDEAIDSTEIANIQTIYCNEITTETQLVITTQPTGTYTNVALGATVIEVRDAYNQVVTSSNLRITAEIYTGTGTFIGTTMVQAIDGIATFSNLKIYPGGDFTLRFTNPCVTPAISESFSLIYFLDSINVGIPNVSLFIKNAEENNVNLFTHGNKDFIKIMRMFLKSNPASQLNLFLKSNIKNVSLINLYSRGAYSNTSTLFIDGAGRITATRMLFTKSLIENAISLFTLSNMQSNLNMFVKCIVDDKIELFLKQDPQKILPLYISGPKRIAFNSKTNLYMQGDEAIRIFYRGMNLFIRSCEHQSLNLYMEVPLIGDFSGGMTLYTQSLTIKKNIENYLNLTLFNDTLGKNTQKTLYIEGTGTSQGYLPNNGQIDLFVSRDNEHYANIMNLFVEGKTSSNNYVDLFQSGYDNLNSSVNLSMPNVVVGSDNKLYLYMHGLNFYTYHFADMKMFIKVNEV
jgi:hypothetical protein